MAQINSSGLFCQFSANGFDVVQIRSLATISTAKAVSQSETNYRTFVFHSVPFTTSTEEQTKLKEKVELPRCDILILSRNGILVPVRTSFGLRRRGGTMYQCKVDVDMLNAVKSVLADVSSVSPSSEQRHSRV